MVSLHHNGLNGILADEMVRHLYVSSSSFQYCSQGLGKTLQTISFLAYLKHHRDISGPHLIVVPKSTLQNWAREFQQWTPDDMNVVILTGTKDERADIIANRLIPQDFEVCITSYEICLIEKSAFKKFSFEYIVIDEAHRIKNVDSILSQIVRSFISRGRLLITGTPLQNSLKELFALLNFICPEIFTEYSDLDSFLHKDAVGAEEEQSKKVVEALHKILRPFLLRRVKSDVEKNLLPSEFHAGIFNDERLMSVDRKGNQHLRWSDGDAEEVVSVGAGEGHRCRQRCVTSPSYSMCFLFCSRVDWKEGGQDQTDEHGHAGMHRRRWFTRIYLINPIQLRKVTCHPYLFDGAVSSLLLLAFMSIFVKFVV
jgi:hypothetical protein